MSLKFKDFVKKKVEEKQIYDIDWNYSSPFDHFSSRFPELIDPEWEITSRTIDDENWVILIDQITIYVQKHTTNLDPPVTYSFRIKVKCANCGEDFLVNIGEIIALNRYLNERCLCNNCS